MDNQAKRERFHRLVGDGNSGGGLPLPPLFVTILERLHDGGPASKAELTKLVEHRIGKRERCTLLYGPDDPWGGLTSDALEQLADRDIVQAEDDTWRLGEAFRANQPMTIIPARKGKNEKSAVTVYSADRRAVLGDAEVERMEIASLAGDLREDGPGLRPLNPKRVAELAKSIRLLGFDRDLGILRDQYGRILDGRHRIAAARQTGMPDADIPQREVQVESDADAIGKALKANNASGGWSSKEFEKIANRLRAAGSDLTAIVERLRQRDMRRLIEQELRENADRSDRVISRKFGCSKNTVAAVRAELTTTGQIDQLSSTIGTDNKRRPASRAEPSLADRLRAILVNADGQWLSMRELTDRLSEGRPEREIASSVSARWRDLSGEAGFEKRREGRVTLYRYASPEVAEPAPEPEPEPEPWQPPAEWQHALSVVQALPVEGQAWICQQRQS